MDHVNYFYNPHGYLSIPAARRLGRSRHVTRRSQSIRASRGSAHASTLLAKHKHNLSRAARPSSDHALADTAFHTAEE
eukprot:scaffold43165_cov129-Isochrysis_galbana.AAC.4